MEPFPLFFRIRAITFTSIMLFSFLWLVLLCVEMFTRWSTSDQITHSLMVVFILTNTTTLIMLPILILVDFRVWLDAARLFLLFVLQVGSATAGSIWSPRIQCPDENPDDFGVCQLISVYTLIACWTIPTILVIYLAYFTLVVHLRSLAPVVVEPNLQKRRSGLDLELGSTESLSLWNEKMRQILGLSSPNVNKNLPPRPLVLPSIVHARQSSQSSTPEGQSTVPNPPRRQSTVPTPPHTGQQPLTLSSVPTRHHSLPAFRHGTAPNLRPPLTLHIPHALDANASSSYPRTSSSRHSPSNPQNLSFRTESSAGGAQSGVRWSMSKHLSMMPSCSSPRETQSAECSFRPAKLTKPLPAHLL